MLNSMWVKQKFKAPSKHSALPGSRLEDGMEQGESRYKAYLMWLGWVGVMCGWEWEKEG